MGKSWILGGGNGRVEEGGRVGGKMEERGRVGEDVREGGRQGRGRCGRGREGRKRKRKTERTKWYINQFMLRCGKGGGK